MTIKLYGFGFSRSQRCEWALKELGLEYDFIDVIESNFIADPAYKKLNPYGAMPVIEVDGKPLFESAAICTYLADLHPDKGMIPKTGTYERGQYEQWVSFALSNLESWLWAIAKQKMRYPEEKRVPQVVPSYVEEFKDSAQVLDEVLGRSEHLIGDSFSMADVIMGYVVNWARKAKLLEEFANLQAYNARHLQREACPFEA